MEISIVQLLYLLRPMLSAELVDWGFLGLNFLELVAILLFLAVVAAFFLGTLQKNHQPTSGVEVWAAMVIVWVTISYIVHIEISSVATYAKFVIPLATYILLKRILPDRSTHVRMVFLMLLGSLVPFIMSAMIIYQGEGVHDVIYWTGLTRYKGVYYDNHNLGHNAALALMSTVVYVALRKSQKVPLTWAAILVLAAVTFLGFYLLYAAQVRNTYVALVVFISVVLYFFDKRILAFFVVLLIGIIVVFWSQVVVIFHDFLNPPDLGWRDPLGSGRRDMWTWALEYWRQAPLLNQLTGAGVKYPEVSPIRMPEFGTFAGQLRPWADPHNDWLFVLLSLGLIGLAIFVGLFGSILRAILSIRGKEKFALLGVFAAVVLMNAMSNSYFTRFSLFQMFFMLMVYVDLKSAEVKGKSQTTN